MAEFERSTTVGVGPDEAFRYLADPGNLPRYVATMVRAEPEGGERLRIAADVEGRHEEGGARFQADPDRRRLEWGGEGGSQYGGWLQVSDASGGTAVTIHLHVVHDEDQVEVNRVLDETIGNIERLLSMSE